MTRERQTPRTEPFGQQAAAQRPIALMDTTLRDGEQTPDLSFSCDEKLRIAAALLRDVGVDRVEIGSARVSAGELATARAGAAGLHVTVNGLGERAGNASLSAVVAGLRDHTRRAVAVDEGRLFELSRLVAAASGCAVAHNAPIVGAHVFTQTAGVHADGDAKGGLYGSRLRPERFGRERRYALGKLSGRASLQHHLQALGVVLAPEALDALLAEVVAEGERKRRVRAGDLLRFIRGGQRGAQGASSARPGEAGDSGNG